MQKYNFPKGFYWGAASASYQVEGNIFNNDWAKAAEDGFVPFAGDGPDHYSRYEKDFDLAKSIGHNCHRLSIEWSRIEPKEGYFDEKEIEHYKNVIQALEKRGLTPFITLWHFTLPNWFVEKGGFTKKRNVKYFARYAKRVTDSLKDCTAFWTTFNEPMVYASNGWMRGNWPPFRFGHFFEMWNVVNNLARAHNAAYIEIKKHDPDADVSVVKNNIYFHGDTKLWNKAKAKVVSWFWNDRFLRKVKNYCDSIGVNYYFHSEYSSTKSDYPKSDMGWDLYPEGLYHVLVDVAKYKKPIFVSEAGIADEKDSKRAWYIKELIYNMWLAIDDGVDLRGYMYWSLIDNYEWSFGYQKRFGLIAVDYETKERKIRESAYEYKAICKSNTLLRK